MREYGGDIHFINLEAQTFVKKRCNFKVVLKRQTIAFILDIYL